MTQERLRDMIVESLYSQGFCIRDGMLSLPDDLSKDSLRHLHRAACDYRRAKAQRTLAKHEARLLSLVASGQEVEPSSMSPRLVEVQPGSEEALLFRYASLHWSIPVSSGYGRRLRFLVVDESNGKLIGLIGLADPVFGLRPRDEWVGWTHADRKKRLRNAMEAFVLGAVPPYSFLLCGKLVAMLAASGTVRHAFQRRYGGTRSVIRGALHDGHLVLITTASALGRSSIYNRLRFEDRLLYQSVGFTKGSGEFHFASGIYELVTEFAAKHCEPTARHERWGTGFRNRREVIKKCLPALGLSSDWMYHGIKREVFVVPLAENTREFLRGESETPRWYEHPETRLFEHFRDRWMLPRASWDTRWRSWSKDEWCLWQHALWDET